MRLVSDTGHELHIAQQLGRGGEGTAYLLSNAPGYVAKVYHQTLPDLQIAKLRYMASICNDSLLSHTAWPKALISRKGERIPCGFIMPLAKGLELHEVYGPSSRRRRLPTATWEFLILVARNAACAFSTVHERGVVVGDVNEKNLFVNDDGRVVLVDCDSYQLSSGGRLYPCRVGVPLYTPPELQGHNLAQCQRSPDHDAFGLAVLIFQLLFMGRHPFAGVTSNAQFLAIENGYAIRNGLYAYGSRALASGISVPPNTLPITSVPLEVQALFESAFAHAASNGGRPSAKRWVQALDTLRQKLVTCRVEKSHRYSNHVGQCPWCALARDSGIHYFICVSFANYVDVTADDVAAFKRAIDQLNEKTFVIRSVTDFALHFTVEATPIPQAVKGPSGDLFTGIIVVLGSVLLGFAFPLAFLGVFWGIALFSGSKTKPEYHAEQSRRRTRRDQVQQQVATLHAELQRIPQQYRVEYSRKKAALTAAFQKFAQIPQERQRALLQLEQKKRQVQLVQFLDQFLIAKYKISGIGPTREAMLISYGVETAADITAHKVTAIPGFKHHLYGLLSQWRRSCEARFVFDPSMPIPQGEIDAVNRRLISMKTTLQEEQRALIKELVDLGDRTTARMAELDAKLEAHCRELKQAQSDLAVFGP